MSDIPTLADRLAASTVKAENASQIMHDVANSGVGVEVPTASGPVPSIQEWYARLNDRTSGAVGVETAAREAADAALQDTLDSEATARSDADAALQTALGAEAYARASADGVLQAALNTKFDKAGGLISGVFGYGLGAGGSVVQPTSKSTAVTLHKPCGRIYLSDSTLLPGEVVAIPLVNSTCTELDSILVTAISGLAYDASHYTAHATVSPNGTIFIMLKNINTVAQSDPVVLNFAIIKGAAT